jgi:hypothetical protein
MSAPTIAPDVPDDPTPAAAGSIGNAVPAPLVLHTPGPIPPVDDDDDEDDDRKGGGTGGGNIDPDDDEDVDDDDDEDDDEADKQWARGTATGFVL